MMHDDLESFLEGLHAAGVHDERVLAAIAQVPREMFMAPHYGKEAYADRALPIACGQTISQPVVVALMTQALELEARDKVFEVGTGSGYQAAVLSLLCRRVYSIERHRELHVSAGQLLTRLGLRNVTTLLGDGWKGWPELGPYDRIIVTAAADEVPEALLGQLKIGGIMVVPVGEQYSDQVMMRLRRTASGIVSERLFPVRFVPMVHGLAAGARA